MWLFETFGGDEMARGPLLSGLSQTSLPFCLLPLSARVPATNFPQYRSSAVYPRGGGQLDSLRSRERRNYKPPYHGERPGGRYEVVNMRDVSPCF